MPVTEDDVRHIAALARLRVDPARLPSLVSELNSILTHMGALSKVKTEDAQEAIGVGDGGMTLRDDAGPPLSLARDLTAFAPQMRDGFFLVPRLATHETAGIDSVSDDEGENVIAESAQDGENDA